ncbi:hypothetical protein [Humibacter ginsenosidimutans]|uniref:Uncharacterized protein n=1 Tax=Humibacter ginsenosidimutans TaxID=2599293 RepID=A0A5B8M3F0_9MICO|nr:hypothetical protein [Humibacter ginsenosidimutans]QDZ14474.1 hypothetical protein FPZ11_06595 [Humibacter ginsenosidimutans]
MTEPPSTATREADIELRFLDAMTEVARTVLGPTTQSTYLTANEEAGQFVIEYVDAHHGRDAYSLWMEVSDLFDHFRGPQSDQLCDEEGRKAARKWLSLDLTSEREIDAYFQQWWPAEFARAWDQGLAVANDK